jgi:hypothetical protein
MSNRKSIVLAFVSTKQAHADAITALVADMKGTPYIKYRAEAAAIIGVKYSVEPHVSQLKKWMTFEKDTAAEQALSALMKHHPKRPTSGSTAPAATLPKATFKAVQTTIIEAELTKAQFDLLISELRATIQFV